MRYTPEDEEEPAPIRRLRRLSMALMVVLMLGIVVIAGTIVIRLGFAGGAERVAAESFSLPEGEVVGMGQGPGTTLFLMRDADGAERLLVFDAAEGGAPISVTPVRRD